MKLTINGNIYDTLHAKTVFELLGELDIDPQGVAVEVNISIVKKDDYPTFPLKDGDSVEIVNFVGGG